MKPFFFLMIFVLPACCYAQEADSLPALQERTAGIVSFVTRLDKKNATRDGIYLNGYLVNMSSLEIIKFHGRTIQITGKVTILKAISILPDEPVTQGRRQETKYINSPVIRIIR